MHFHALDGKPGIPDYWCKLLTTPEAAANIERLKADAAIEAALVVRLEKQNPTRASITAVGPRGEFHEERTVSEGKQTFFGESLHGYSAATHLSRATRSLRSANDRPDSEVD
jgi:hypothetical protein